MLQREDGSGAALRKVARALGQDPAALRRKLQKGARFVWLARRVSPQEAAAVEAITREARLRGVGLVQETRRYYPKGDLASQVLGAVGDDGNGLEGVELALEDLLAGAPAKVPSLRDGAGRTVLAGVRSLALSASSEFGSPLPTPMIVPAPSISKRTGSFAVGTGRPCASTALTVTGTASSPSPASAARSGVNTSRTGAPLVSTTSRAISCPPRRRVRHLEVRHLVRVDILLADRLAVEQQPHARCVARDHHVDVLAFAAGPVPVRHQLDDRAVLDPLRLVDPERGLGETGQVHRAEEGALAGPLEGRRLAAVVDAGLLVGAVVRAHGGVDLRS